MRRFAIPSSAVLLFNLAFAAPVLAAAPTNDTYAGRTIIASLPYVETLDTSEATTDAIDAELTVDCVPPATEASVWYEWTATADMGVLVDVSGSDYSAGVIVTTGSPGAFGPTESCGPGGAAFFATAGTTYVIFVFDDQTAGDGGTLELSVAEAPPPPDIDVTVDPIGRFDSTTGVATITGTVTCTADAFAFLEASLRQSVGRFTVSGFGFAEVLCDGTTQPWSLEIVSDSGLYKGGKAAASVVGLACTFDCGVDVAETTIRLKR